MAEGKESEFLGFFIDTGSSDPTAAATGACSPEKIISGSDDATSSRVKDARGRTLS